MSAGGRAPSVGALPPCSIPGGSGKRRRVATESTTDFTLDSAAALAADEQGEIEGKSPWLLAWRRLRRNYVALGSLVVFIVILSALCVRRALRRSTSRTRARTTTTSARRSRRTASRCLSSRRAVLSTAEFIAGGIPVGPQLWHAGGRYVFGADNQGRDVAVRLLYGGRNSLQIGIGSAIYLHVLRAPLGAARRLLRRLDRLVHLARLRPDLGFPGVPPRDRARHGALDQRLPPLGINIEAGSLWIPTA